MAARRWMVNCPTCGKRVTYNGRPGKRFFPFCSERCKLLDLGKWLAGEYRIEEPLEGESRGPEPEERRGNGGGDSA